MLALTVRWAWWRPGSTQTQHTNCLRVLCERGRATAPSGVLATLMGPKLPRELFVHVLSFWRSARALDDRTFDRVRGRYLPTRYDYWYSYEAPDEVIMG